MGLVLLLIRLGLAAVFVVAAVAKAADRRAFRDTVQQFGVPRALVGPVCLGLPVAELAIAAGLVGVESAAWAALGAVGLLGVFCVGIFRLMARGEAPDCRCFGALSPSPVGRGTLARNLVLLSLAAYVGIVGWSDPGDSVSRLAGELGAVALVLGIAFCVHAAFSWQLFRQNGRLLDRLEALEGAPQRVISEASDGALTPGLPAPPFALPDLDGRIVTLGDLLAGGGGTLLLFTDPGCGHCDPLFPVLGALHDGPRVAVISRGTAHANRTKAGVHGLTTILLQNDFEVADAYHAYGMPAAVLVDDAGRIASETVAGADGIVALLGISGRPTLGLVHVEGVA